MQNTLLHEVTGMGELEWPESAPEIALLLIENGSEVDATEQQSRGETPLHHAVSVNNVEVAEVLLKKGADPEKTGRFDGTMDTALGYALFYGTDARLKRFFRNCPELLMDYGARVYLPFAAAMNKIDEVKSAFLGKSQLRRGVGKADDKTTIQQAFLFACRYGHIDVADYLLQKGANINASIPFFTHQATGLHLACETENSVELVRFLLKKGVNPKIKDGVYNATAEGWAMFCGQDKTYKALRNFKK
jgi:ankyrin repeat protein